MSVDLSKVYRYVFGRQVTVDLPAMARAYKIALGSPDGKKHILPDLLKFTGVLMPAPMYGDEFSRGRAQGRRDVGLHILENLTLEPDELYAIYKGQPVIKPGDFTNG